MTANESRRESQVGIGTMVVIELISASGEREPMSVRIVNDQAADYDAGLIGANTPLAKALLGKFVDTTVPYGMGDIKAIHIVEIFKPAEQAPADGASRRQASYDEALRKAERTNAEMFASSYDSKWGGYELDEEH
jgi:transcription elongation GreA/GreB family factor